MKTKEKNPIYVLRNISKRHVDLMGKEGKSRYVLIKDFITFWYNHKLHREKKHFCCCCLQPLSSAELLKSDVNDSFKINGKQMIKMPNKENMLD